MISLEKFINTLFDSGEATCFAETSKGTSITSIDSQIPDNIEFFSINPINPTKDTCPTKNYHKENIPRRADGNVTCFRNFLVEMDDMPLDDQKVYLDKKGIPYTAVTYSGKKSYHYIISLSDPCSNINEYKTIAKRLLTYLDKADQTTKNPSRLSRLPFRTRKDTQRDQSMIYLGDRVDKETLLRILPVYGISNRTEHAVEFKNNKINAKVWYYTGEPDEWMVKIGKGRNSFFHWLGERFKQHGTCLEDRIYYTERAYSNLSSTDKFDLKEAYDAARIGEFYGKTKINTRNK